MTRTSYVVWISCFIGLAVQPAIAQLTGADPNSTQRAAAAQIDKLTQVVNYQGGYKRLHDLADDLSKLTGLTIRCGSANSDWQVRDIPVEVFAKDVPLGKLLRAVADATHLRFAVETVEGDRTKSSKVYRVYRDRRGRDDLVSEIEAKRKARLAEADRAWDTLAKIGKMTDQELTIPTQYLERLSKSRTMSRVIASLDSETKQRVFAGEMITLDARSSAQSDLVRALHGEQAPPQDPNDAGERTKSDLRAGVIEQSVLTIELLDGDDGSEPSLCAHLFPTGGEEIRARRVDLADEAAALSKPDSKLGPRELSSGMVTATAAKEEEPSDDIPGGRYRALRTDEDWQLPILQSKIKIEKPAGSEQPYYEVFFRALAEASGLTIVCDDFMGRKFEFDSSRAVPEFGRETTLGQALKKMSHWHWYIDEADRLILGRAKDWRRHYNALVPEDLLDSLARKIKDGLELDDFIPVVLLTSDQVSDWLRGSKELGTVPRYSSGKNKALWQLYAMLSAEDRKLARSDSGLPFAKLDQSWLASFLRQRQKQIATHGTFDSQFHCLIKPLREKHIAEQRRMADGLNDMSLLESTVMLVKPETVYTKADYGDSYGLTSSHSLSDKPRPGYLERHTYYIELESAVDGRKETQRIDGTGQYFPIYSAKSENELQKGSETEPAAAKQRESDPAKIR